MPTTKTRVAILGGGVGALSAAFALSELDPRGEKYEITLYQLGWRLGGKVANGRNKDRGNRIEEHGLHIWAGFYENAFTIMRAALRALDPPPGAPRRTIADAFVRQNTATFADQQNNNSTPWPFWFQPDNDPHVFPGRDSLFAPVRNQLTVAEALHRIVCYMAANHSYYHPHWQGDPHAQTAEHITTMSKPAQDAIKATPPVSPSSNLHPLLYHAATLTAGLHTVAGAARALAAAAAAELLEGYRSLAEASYNLLPTSEEALRFFVQSDVYARVVLGVIRSNCLRDGFAVLDKYDLRSFMAGNTPLNPAVDCAIVTGGYEYLFSYQQGARDRPLLSACTAVQGFVRLISYQGAFFYRATGGMGDTVATPLYQVLKQRGVSFKFFHQVTALRPSMDGAAIGAIDISEQAALRPGLTEYNPLVTVNGEGCWPSAPLWEQLQNGTAMEAAGKNFEDFYATQSPPAAQHTLRLGEHFDRVILGIPLGALGTLCQPLLDDSSNPKRAKAWADMLANVQTTRTQALQLWVNPPLADLGGPFVAHIPPPAPLPMEGDATSPLVTAFTPPFDTYADMSHLLPTESWPAENKPGSIGYFCAVLDDGASPNDHAAATEAVRENAIDWMTNSLGTLWTSFGHGADFRWDKLYAPATATGEARLDHQYYRANISPSERYVLSLPGTLQYRMDPGGSGYSNLFLAGDWTRVPDINAGCVEVAAMSGLAAASALSGTTIPIASLTTLYPQLAPPPAAAGAPGTPPAFIDFPGWSTVPPPPDICRDTEFYSLAFAANHTACQSFLDMTYNRAAGRQRFRVLLDRAFLTVVKSGKVGAADPPFSLAGTMTETDIGFWLLVGDFDEYAFLPRAIGGVPTYLFVNNAAAVAGGREIWGFPKTFATITSPDDYRSGGPFEVTALAFDKCGPTEQATQHRVLSLHGDNVSYSGLISTAIDTFKQLCAGADKGLLHNLFHLPGIQDFLNFPALPFPVFYLKQFRDAANPAIACYQQLLEGPLLLTETRDCGMLTGTWQLELDALESLSLISTLGLGTPTNGKLLLTARHAFWADIDFKAGLAVALSQQPQGMAALSQVPGKLCSFLKNVGKKPASASG